MNQQDIGEKFRGEFEALIVQLQGALAETINATDDRPALAKDAGSALEALREPLSEKGCGARESIDKLLEMNIRASANTGGPKCFHFIIGGSTPASMAADLLATAFETITYTWDVSPVGVEMELQALAWLKELFDLPASMHGIMVTGATMANFVGLAAGRQWWGEQHGFDVSETGMSGKPHMPVLTSGFVHASSLKVLAMLGVGRSNVQQFSRDDFGRLDIGAMQRALEDLDGQPAVVIVNAGEVNSGEFDPVSDMIALAREHNCWVHVDGAFGLFARVSPRIAHFANGVEQADSITVDGHKWLNVPFDSGYAFVRDRSLMAKVFRYSANYLPAVDNPRPTLGAMGPESSRRARSFAVWATLKAYGREGHRQIVEHCLDIAQHFAEQVRRRENLELMADVPLNIVAFRFNPGGLSEQELDSLNQRLGQTVISDGRFMAGTSKIGPRTIFRPAFSNWRTRKHDVEEFASVMLELGRGLL
ncbi:MAG: aminotransferase class V-fold PLP-dependent enzyme [Gammaproteobacteria bacterium]|nr:aminotransferase class V-fold PLP-dependent enzyme [Gammaproteobacteria bacterium]NNK98934.1 aspartate aminotransferase family protein [Xanthomonadales bacterium]